MAPGLLAGQDGQSEAFSGELLLLFYFLTHVIKKEQHPGPRMPTLTQVSGFHHVYGAVR